MKHLKTLVNKFFAFSKFVSEEQIKAMVFCGKHAA